MGIVAKQSFYNIISILIAFAIGAVNTVIFYPRFLGEAFFGLIVILLAESNILQPIFSFGLQHTLIKYFSATDDHREKDKLLWFSILIPIGVIFPSGILFFLNYDAIGHYLATENPLIADFIYLIFLIAISTAYFEIFLSWVRVQKKTIVGNFLKEVYQRVLISLLLLLYAFQWIDIQEFIYGIIIGYYLRLLIIMAYSLSLYRPVLIFELPKNYRQLIGYSALIFLSAFGASIIIDIDSAMLGKLVETKYVAYYKVAIFIAVIIDAPGRAMFQIVSPLVAEALNNDNKKELESLLKKSSTSLFLVAGLIFLLINANIDEIYKLIAFLNGNESFALAIPVVLMISTSKLFTAVLGCLNNIITNSKYFYFVPFFSIGSAVAVIYLNIVLIEQFGFMGAALATLTVISVFNLVKLLFVMRWFNIHPFAKETIYLLILIVFLYFGFSNISIGFTPTIDILIKSVGITLIYLSVSYFTKLSSQVNRFIDNILKTIRSAIG